MRDENGIEYRDCIVGNIIGDHYYGVQKEIRSGTKHFKPDTKVYCAFIYGGMGHEQVLVMGKPRKSFRMIKVVIPTSFIKNFRESKVYHPKVIAFLEKHDHSSFDLPSFLQSLNECNTEIKNDATDNIQE